MPLLSLFGLPLLACAQITPPPESPDVGPPFTFQPAAPEALNKIGLSYEMGLNISVDFRKLGGRFSQAVPLAGTAVNRTYDDGYNLVDIDNNNHGGYIGTWYWGNYSPNSVQGQNLVYQSYSSLPNVSSRGQADGPQNGFEIPYSRQLWRGEKWRGGVEAVFSYSRISVVDGQSLQATAYRTNDFFALNGVLLGRQAYTNTFTGPGPVISSQPGMRTVDVLPGAATITGSRDLNSDVFLFRLGPYVEYPLTERLSAIFDGGLTIGFGCTDLRFTETVTITDPAYAVQGQPLNVAVSRSGGGWETDFLVGGYVGANLSYAITKEINLVAGAHFQAAGHAINDSAAKQAVLDLNKSVIVSIGATYSF